MSAAHKPRVVVVRGHQVTPWEIGQWEPLTDRFDVVVVRTASSPYEARTSLPARPARALRDVLPRGRLGDLAVRLPGDRYLRPANALRGADIVHAQELGYWYSAQAARQKRSLGFRLVLTVWETLPFLASYRNVRTRPYRRLTLAHADRFLAATERARDALLLEGAPADRVSVSPPGIDVARFAASEAAARSPRHRVLSVGRLVWEKGHQDAIRAVAALRRGLAGGPPVEVELVIVGSGPERARLRAHADELGVGPAVDIREFTPYEEMPALFASASCLVLASLALPYWEEQFGMVLAEAMAAGLPIVASTSGAIPEVTGGAATYFAPGDWSGLARALREGPLARAPGDRVVYDPALLERYGREAAAARLAEVYDELLASRS